MTQIKVVQGDKGYDINFTLQDANGAAYDLSGGTLILKVQKQGAATVKFSGAMAIVSGPAGTCKYTVAATDFDSPGKYYGEIEASFSSGTKIVTWEDIVLDVRPELPR